MKPLSKLDLDKLISSVCVTAHSLLRVTPTSVLLARFFGSARDEQREIRLFARRTDVESAEHRTEPPPPCEGARG